MENAIKFKVPLKEDCNYGNSWYEVPYLGQETIYEEIANKPKFDQTFENNSPDDPPFPLASASWLFL